MLSRYSDSEIQRVRLTLESVKETIDQLIEWNKDILSADDYHLSRHGMQLLAANCTLITAIGEGVNRINRTMPGFLEEHHPEVPWHAIVSMRNRIAHGYFEVDSEIVFETIRTEMPPLREVMNNLMAVLS